MSDLRANIFSQCLKQDIIKILKESPVCPSPPINKNSSNLGHFKLKYLIHVTDVEELWKIYTRQNDCTSIGGGAYITSAQKGVSYLQIKNSKQT